MIVGGMVILGVGYGAYKLGQKDVDQIEQHTGKKAEDLSQEELEAAMDDLGIQDQEVSDQELAALEAADSAAQAPAAPSQPAPAAEPAPQAGGGSESYIEELEKLAQLKDQGIITDEEFQAKKRQLLGLD